MSGAAGDAGCDVQHPAAEGFDLTRGQVAVFGEADQSGRGHQICCRQDDFKPCGVGVGPVAGQVGQPGGLGLADLASLGCAGGWAELQLAELTGHYSAGVLVMNAGPAP